MNRILTFFIALIMPAGVFAHLGDDVYIHIYDYIAASPVVFAWIAILVVLAALSIVFWFMSRREEAKIKKRAKIREKKHK